MALAQGVELGEKGRTVRGEQGRRVFGRNQQVEIGAPAEIVQDDPVGRSGGESQEQSLPSLELTELVQIEEPSNPYVYRVF